VDFLGRGGLELWILDLEHELIEELVDVDQRVGTGPAIIDREGRVQIYTPEKTE
jgi:hypothetical protein